MRQTVNTFYDFVEDHLRTITVKFVENPPYGLEIEVIK
jgi:hypothetical protein